MKELAQLVDDLYATGHSAVDEPLLEALKDLGDHAKAIVTLVGTPASDEQIDAARELHEGAGVEIDDDARVSEADEGYWAQAWEWVDA